MALKSEIHQSFEHEGFVILGKFLGDSELDSLCQRINSIMLGHIRYEGMFFQLDTLTGKYEDVDGAETYAGPSLNYRRSKILNMMSVFFDLCKRKPLRKLLKLTLVLMYHA